MFRSFGIIVFFHVGVSGVDDGLSEVNHGVLLLPVADDLVLLLDVDKLVAPDGRIVAFFLLSTVAKVQSALPMKRANAPEPGAAIGLRRGRASPSPYRWCTSHSTWCSHRTERRTNSLLKSISSRLTPRIAIGVSSSERVCRRRQQFIFQLLGNWIQQ